MELVRYKFTRYILPYTSKQPCGVNLLCQSHSLGAPSLPLEKVGNSTLDDLEIAFEGHKFQHLGAVSTVPNPQGFRHLQMVVLWVSIKGNPHEKFRKIQV